MDIATNKFKLLKQKERERNDKSDEIKENILNIEKKIEELIQSIKSFEELKKIKQGIILNCLNFYTEVVFNLSKSLIVQNKDFLVACYLFCGVVLNKLNPDSNDLNGLFVSLDKLLSVLQKIDTSILLKEVEDYTLKELTKFESRIEELKSDTKNARLVEIILLYCDLSKSYCENASCIRNIYQIQNELKLLKDQKFEEELSFSKLKILKENVYEEKYVEEQIESLSSLLQFFTNQLDMKKDQARILESKVSEFSYNYYYGLPTGLSEEEKNILYGKK